MLVEGVGMGCTLIRRDLVTRMLEKMPELVDTRLHLHPAGDTIRQAGSNRLIRAFEKLDLPERGIVSEDLSFCIRWQQCGGETWAAIGYKISHVGPYDYAGRYLDQVENAIAQPALPVGNGGTTITEVMEVVGKPVDGPAVVAETPPVAEAQPEAQMVAAE